MTDQLRSKGLMQTSIILNSKISRKTRGNILKIGGFHKALAYSVVLLVLLSSDERRAPEALVLRENKQQKLKDLSKARKSINALIEKKSVDAKDATDIIPVLNDLQSINKELIDKAFSGLDRREALALNKLYENIRTIKLSLYKFKNKELPEKTWKAIKMIETKQSNIDNELISRLGKTISNYKANLSDNDKIRSELNCILKLKLFIDSYKDINEQYNETDKKLFDVFQKTWGQYLSICQDVYKLIIESNDFESAYLHYSNGKSTISSQRFFKNTLILNNNNQYIEELNNFTKSTKKLDQLVKKHKSLIENFISKKNCLIDRLSSNNETVNLNWANEIDDWRLLLKEFEAINSCGTKQMQLELQKAFNQFLGNKGAITYCKQTLGDLKNHPKMRQEAAQRLYDSLLDLKDSLDYWTHDFGYINSDLKEELKIINNYKGEIEKLIQEVRAAAKYY